MRGRDFSLRSRLPRNFLAPSQAGRGGSVSRRDHNQAARKCTAFQAEPPMQKHSTQSPATLRERGSGGEALLLEKRPLPQNLRRPSHPSICVLQTVATVIVAAPMARS